MIRIGFSVFALLAVVACTQSTGSESDWPEGLQPQEVQSGYSFLTTETQALQDDEFANPGYLWVDRGARLFSQARDGSPACASCHSEGVEGVAASYPNIDAESGQLINLEGRINLCRTRHQGLEPLVYESDDLLSLTAFIAEQSKGIARDVPMSTAFNEHLQNGEAYFFSPRGQLNLSCHQCHDQNWGAKLRGDTISQGHLNSFPAYRLEWESLGSSHRRLRDCDLGVRAQPLPLGDQRYVEVELYLAERAAELALESPAVRR